jgi:hypothetical protein
MNLPVPNGRSISFAAYAGVLAVALNRQPASWHIGTSPVPPEVSKAVHSKLKLGFAIVPPGNAVWIALWIPVSVSAILAAMPWLRLRFGTRTLLLAITLIAILLGTIASLSRLRP